jgi:HEAT repeat protein
MFKKWRNQFLLTILLMGFSTPLWAAGDRNEKLEERILIILKAYEFQPSLKIWKEMGLKRVNKTLSEIALATGAEPRLRSRAALALGDIPSDRTYVTLRGLISDKRIRVGIRRQALVSFARAFPKRSFDQIRAQLLVASKFMREASALAITYVQDVRVEALLVERLSLESEMVVRTALERAKEMRVQIRNKRRGDGSTSPQIAPLTPAQRDGL